MAQEGRPGKLESGMSVGNHAAKLGCKMRIQGLGFYNPIAPDVSFEAFRFESFGLRLQGLHGTCWNYLASCRLSLSAIQSLES